MSTNQTENYGLHVWEAEDDFLREEFNANFELLDEASRVVFGTYTGNGATSKTISLGFTPKAVLIMPQRGFVQPGDVGIALAYEGHPIENNQLCIAEGGFTVKQTGDHSALNLSGETKHYIVWK